MSDLIAPSIHAETRPDSRPRRLLPDGAAGRWGLRATALAYLALFIIIPMIVVAVQGLRDGFAAFWSALTSPVALHAIGLTLSTAAIMVAINAVIGTLTAYVLVAYKFRGKALFNAAIDLPLAIPPLVTGVMLVLLYGPQTAIGGFFQNTLGIKILFAPPAIVLALLFLAYPSVIRAVEPALLALESNQQEAAHTLGASPFTTFRRVILPEILPAILTGSLVNFARALGEFGAAIVVTGNIPLKTQTATVYVYAQIEGDKFASASAVSFVLLLVAFVITLVLDFALRKNVHA